MAKKNEPDAPGVNPTPVYVGGESFADKIVPHVKKILIVVGVVSVVMSIFFVWRWWQHRKAEKQTAALVIALDHARADAPAPDDEQPPQTEQARAEAALAKLRQVEGDPRSGAALLEADLLFTAGQLDAAEALFRKLSGRAGVEGVAAREGVGFVAEARAQGLDGEAKDAELGKALEAFRAAQPDEAGPRREYALYHEGRILAQLGKKEEARTVLEQALAKATEVGSDLEAIIEMRLTQLDLPAISQGGAPTKPEEK